MAFKRYLIIIGLILFAVILSRLNLTEIIRIIQQLDVSALIIVLILLVMVILLKAYKWHVILDAHAVHIPFPKTFQIYCIGFFLSLLTPGRFGDVARGFYLRSKTPLSIGLLTVIIDRLIDIFLLFTWAAFAMILFSFLSVNAWVSAGMLIGSAILGVVCIYFFSKKENVKLILRPFFNIFIPDRWKIKLQFQFEVMFEALEKFKKQKRKIAYLFLLGCVIWLLVIQIGFVLIRGLKVSLPFEFMFVVIPLISLIELVPITFSGIGTRDALLIFLFSFYSISAEYAVAFSLIYFVLGYLLIALLGFLFFIQNPLVLPRFSDN